VFSDRAGMPMIESARFVSGVTPIFMVGDSNTIVFDNLLFECPAFFAQPFIGRALFCSGLSAAEFTTSSDRLNPLLFSALLQHLLVLGDESSWYPVHAPLATARTKIEEAELRRVAHRWETRANDHVKPRPIVIMVGTLDLAAILRTLPSGCDFAVKDDRYPLGAFAEEPVGPYIPAQFVHDLVAERLKPLERGLALLREGAFTNVYLHSLHPPAVEDRKYTNARTDCTQASLRYKVALTINAQYRALCERQGVRYLDMWAATTKDGLLDPQFEFDGDHLNKFAAHLTMRAVLADLAARVLPKSIPLSDLAWQQPAG
jgi:lysophospholipase L1-like esterase